MENFRNQMYKNNCNCQNYYNNPSDYACNMYQDKKDYSCLESLPLAMAYVPIQKLDKTFDFQNALYHGTIFPELCLPLKGCKGGRM